MLVGSSSTVRHHAFPTSSNPSPLRSGDLLTGWKASATSPLPCAKSTQTAEGVPRDAQPS